MVDILEEIKTIISHQFGIPHEEIEEESLLDEDLSITDLDLEDFISHVEEKYDITIPEGKKLTFKKVSDIVSYIYDNVEIST